MNNRHKLFDTIAKRNRLKKSNDSPPFFETSNRKIIVLDDDPTGVQTLHDVAVLTHWSKELISEQISSPDPVFFILTNIRSKNEQESQLILEEIMTLILEVTQELKVHYTIVSRSDSTLRGHYPLDVNTLNQTIQKITPEKAIDGHLLIPMLFEDGRVTYQNIHYLMREASLLPIGESEFAADHLFGYQSSNLIDWINEKNGNYSHTNDTLIISIDDIDNHPEKILDTLLKAHNNQPIVVNATNYHDLYIIITAIITAEKQGKNFIFRSGASFIKAFANISDKTFLDKEHVIAQNNQQLGGLIVIGSVADNTNKQIAFLRKHTENLICLELDVSKILIPAFQSSEILKLSSKVNHYLQAGKNVLIYTSRQKVITTNQNSTLNISQIISHQLINIIKSLSLLPRYVIAKGGTTASDIIINGFEIEEARILGQISYGIPVWLSSTGLPIIVFPGNVGQADSLANIVALLS